MYGVEPEGANTMQRSLAAGAPQRMAQVRTLALAPPMSLPYSFELCRAYLDQVVTVSDDEICRAMAMLFHDAKLALESAAAAALAAAIGPLRPLLHGQRTTLIVCGANIDAEGYARLLARGEAVR